MATTVPEVRVPLSQAGVRVSNSVRSGEWVSGAWLHNWIAGRPAVIVPCHAPMVTIAAGVESAFPYWIAPRYQDTRYRVSVLLTAETPTTATIKVDGATVGTSCRAESRRNAVVHTFDVERASMATTEVEIVVAVTAGASSVDVEAIMIEALPRVFLAEDANDLGSERMKFWLREAISERNFANALLDYQSNLRDSARRCGCFAHSWGTKEPRVITSAGFTDLFDGTISMLGRKLYDGDTTTTLYWAVKAWVDPTDEYDAVTGQVQIVNDASTYTINVPVSGVSAWHGKTAILSDAEDNSTSTGLRGAATDDWTISAKRTAGTGDVCIESVCVWEA